MLGHNFFRIKKPVKQRDYQLALIELEERSNPYAKRRREHKAVISDIPKNSKAELENLDPNSTTFRTKVKNRLCSSCYEMATKVVSYDYRGIQLNLLVCTQSIFLNLQFHFVMFVVCS